MKIGTVIWVAVAFVVLLYGTVAVFEAFDRVSHSNSDTIRPFVITMAPVWAVGAGHASGRVGSTWVQREWALLDVQTGQG